MHLPCGSVSSMKDMSFFEVQFTFCQRVAQFLRHKTLNSNICCVVMSHTTSILCCLTHQWASLIFEIYLIFTQIHYTDELHFDQNNI